MTNKNFIILIFVSILFAISAAISINLNTQNYNFKDRGEIFLNNFTQNINDINVISIESFENNIDLVKKRQQLYFRIRLPIKKGYVGKLNNKFIFT